MSIRRLARFAPATILVALASACGSDDKTPPADTSTPDVATEADVAPDTVEPDVTADIVEPDPFRVDLSLVPPAGAVVAGVTAKQADLVGGPKAEGLVGDIKIANNKAAFIIEGMRAAGGYRQNGGHLVDLDLQPGGEDRFGELWFVFNFGAFTPSTVDIVSDGRDGRAIVRVAGRLGPYAWIDGILQGLLGAGETDLAVTLEYALEPDSEVLELSVTAHNDTATNIQLDYPLLAANMGDGAIIFTRGPGLGDAQAGELPVITALGMVRSYGLIALDAIPPSVMAQLYSVQLATLPGDLIFPGASRTWRFAYVVTDDGTNTIERIRAERFNGDATAVLRGQVANESGWLEGEHQPSHTAGKTRVVATRGAEVIAIVPVRADGTFEMHVPEGSFQLQAFAPGRGASPVVEVTAVDGTPTDTSLALPDLGRVDIAVTDAEGAWIPSQVQFFRTGDTPSPFGPEASRFEPDWGRGRSAVVFATEPDSSVQLLPGTYRVVASRGYSWEIAEVNITVAPGLTETVALTLTKTVDDTGWLAADLHLHSFWSPDADVPYPVRLRQAAANDIVLPVFTEHTYMGDLAAPRIEAGTDAWVTPIHGQEVSTTEYGHFNAYPLEPKPEAPGYGAVFEHGLPGATLFDAIRAQHAGDKIIQVNHPRGGIDFMAYFNAIDFPTEPGDGAELVPGKADRWSTEWDLIEVYNGRCQGNADNDQSYADWAALYDRGIRKGLASGSDSHGEAAGLGHPRSWVPVGKAAMDADPEAMVAPLRNRQSFVSCGPFVRVTTSDGVGMGGLATVDEAGRVVFDVQVEAPSWMRIDKVRLLERGEMVTEVDLAAWNSNDRPEGLRSGIRFQGALEAAPTHDSWFQIEVVGSGGLAPVHGGDQPYAITNPIDVDADRDGTWTAPLLAGAKHIARGAEARAKATKQHAHPAHDGHGRHTHPHKQAPEHGHDHGHDHGRALNAEGFRAFLRQREGGAGR